MKHAVDEAAKANAETVIVVLGKNADILTKEIDEKKVDVIENKEWEEGMASSVRSGLNTLLQNKPTIDGAIFMVCDQPHISASVLNELITTQQKTGKPIVTCNYGDTIGPPALFHKSFFSELVKLKGDAGARKIIQQNMDEVATVLFPHGKIDIDTEADYNALS